MSNHSILNCKKTDSRFIDNNFFFRVLLSASVNGANNNSSNVCGDSTHESCPSNQGVSGTPACPPTVSAVNSMGNMTSLTGMTSMSIPNMYLHSNLGMDWSQTFNTGLPPPAPVSHYLGKYSFPETFVKDKCNMKVCKH